MLLLFLLFVSYIYSAPEPADTPETINKALNLPTESNNLDHQDLNDINFVFDKKPLAEIIELLAKHKDINIVMPQAADLATLNQETITYKPLGKNSLPIDQAWDLLVSFINLAGFGLYKKDNKTWQIVKLGTKDVAGIKQGTLPLFIDTPVAQIPKSDMYIRYIAYLRNLQVPSGQDDAQNPIPRIINSMKSPAGGDPIFDNKSNSIFMIDQADTIASIMNIIRALDSTGFKDTISVLKLNNVPASEVADIFAKLKAASGRDISSPFIRPQKAENLTSFAADTTVIADNRLNALVLMGRESAINRIESFITNYIDLEPESGSSILHTYDLQYLNAKDFAAVLSQIISTSGGEAQVTQATSGGPLRFFEGAVVKAEGFEEDPDPVTPPLTTDEARVTNSGTAEGEVGITGPIYKGGNRLLIAATQSEWEKIKKIIEMLDHPEPQVILEVVIVDISHDVTKVVGGTIRNPTGNPFGNLWGTTTSFDANSTVTSGIQQGIQALASHITAPENVLGSNPTQLATDLMQIVSSTAGFTDLATTLPTGSLIFSYNDPKTPGIMGILTILDQYVNANVIAHPFLLSTNNKRATITSEDVKRGQGNVVSTGSGSLNIQVQDITAALQVQMIPHLSSLDRLNLQVAVDINQFEAGTLNRTVRRVNTDVILNTGQIFVAGGLNEFTENDVVTETPILSKIPFLGRLFSYTSKEKIVHNFIIFISPTIVPTKLRSGLDIFTTDKIRKARRNISDVVLYGPSKDPVTRLFFGQEEEADDSIKDYLLGTTNAPKFSELETGKERKRAAKRLPKTLIKRSEEVIKTPAKNIIV